MKMIRMRMI